MKRTLRSLLPMLLTCLFLAIGCDGPQDMASPQKLIDSEVEKVMLVVSDKPRLTASELTKDKITALGYASATYEIEYRDIKPDDEKGTVSVTFILKKASLKSKERTITIDDFKVSSKPQNPGKPQNPPSSGTETIMIDETELLSAFGFIKGEQTASAAAKKIAAEHAHIVGALTLTEAQAISYDDKAGTFAVKIKGSKDGKSFEQKMTVTDFTYPYASPLNAVKTCEFNLDAAIEDNLSIDRYIEKINPEIQKHLTFKVLLENSQEISLGETEAYRFKAQASKDGTKLKVSNIQYTLKYRKLTAGGNEEKTEEPYTTMQSTVIQQKKPYFTEDDVFKYVLSKTDESFIKASSGTFASSFSARAKYFGNTDNLLDTDNIKKYTDLYAAKDEGEHLAVDIFAGLYNAKHGTISANDAEGTLELQYCITTREKFEAHITNTALGSQIKAVSKPVTKSGFKKADAAALKALFEFKIEKKPQEEGAAAQTAWKDYRFPTSDATWPLLANGTPRSFPSTLNGKPFRITINADDNPQVFFAEAAGTHLSKGTDGLQILLNSVILTKAAGVTDLTVTFVLSNNENVDVVYLPAIH